MPKQNETLYIAYGSNLNLEQMKRRCPTAEVVGSSKLEGYELTFRGNRKNAVATIEPSLEENKVPILLWKLQPGDERALDVYEGWPSFYRKETHDVEIGGRTVQAMAYVMNEGHLYEEPSEHYLNTIREGYKSAGFDTDYLDQAAGKSTEWARVMEMFYPSEEQEAEGQEFDMGGHMLDMG
jgi:hypothetical protein